MVGRIVYLQRSVNRSGARYRDDALFPNNPGVQREVHNCKLDEVTGS